jgi:3-hydroxybutyryl-CoA dehydrogenase
MISAEQVKKVVVVGAGLMGHGIAQVFAQAGIETRLVARREDSLERAMALIEQNLEVLAEFGRAKKEDIPATLGRIHATTDLVSAAEGVDFALETVPEVPDTKKEIFAKLSDICPDDAILATNTSTLNIFDFVEVKNPERLLVAHWWLPAHILPLVDVVPGPETSPEAMALAAALMERVGKRPIVMKKPTTPSIINKLQTSIGMVVGNMLEEGVASAEDIDLAVKMSIGIRMPVIGVVQSLDFTGLDTVYDIMSGYGMVNPVIKEKYDKGHFGAKTSKGIYDYGGRTEAEILEKRDRLYLKLLAVMEDLNTFDPV